MGCPLTRELKQKKNPIFIFKSVRVRLRKSVRLRESVNTEFDWEINVDLKRRPQVELSAYESLR